MKMRFDVRGLVVGGVLVGMVCLLAGAVGSDSKPAVGRFAIDCTNTRCYLVDTMTGQVWTSGDGGFKSPKIKTVVAKVKEASDRFVGKWEADDPDQSEKSVQFNAGGGLVAVDEDSEFKGRWEAAGDQIEFRVDDEAFTGKISADGDLIVSEEGDGDGDRLTFRKVK